MLNCGKIKDIQPTEMAVLGNYGMRVGLGFVDLFPLYFFRTPTPHLAGGIFSQPNLFLGLARIPTDAQPPPVHQEQPPRP